MAGGVDGFVEMDFRSLTESAGEDAIFVSNDQNPKPGSGLRRYAVVAADTKASSGWLIAINPLDQRPLGVVDVELLQPIASLIGSQRANGRLYRELKDMLFGIIRSLTAAIDAKDTYTNGHSLRVARIAVNLAEELGMSSHQRGDIYLMGLLHDVGKIGIKDEVLKKNGALTPDEYREIKKHVEIGVDILKDLTKLHHLLPAVRHHHEAYDGSGYPDALQGEDIPFEARILAVADAFDAMASDRPYRKGLGQSRMRQIFKEGASRQWDPSIVEALFERWEDIAEITAKQCGKTLAQVVDDNLKQGSSSRRISPNARGGPAVGDL
jgi:putative nucleotidyltransferase with HDIG domain